LYTAQYCYFLQTIQNGCVPNPNKFTEIIVRSYGHEVYVYKRIKYTFEVLISYVLFTHMLVTWRTVMSEFTHIRQRGLEIMSMEHYDLTGCRLFRLGEVSLPEMSRLNRP
jgi:hypothetical protein